MSNNKELLKYKINFFEDFKELYFKIIKDFKFDYKKDCKSRDILSKIIEKKSEYSLYNLEKILQSFKKKVQSRENIYIYGSGGVAGGDELGSSPSLVSRISLLEGAFLSISNSAATAS